jgi:hypothetical protein
MPHEFRHRSLVLAALASVSLLACSDSAPPPSQPAAAATAAGGTAVPGPAAQTPPEQKPADQPVNRDARALAGFLERMNQYVALHKKLEDSLPHLSKESSPQQIDKHQRSLGEMIRKARAGAKPGDIFTPESQTAIKALLARVLGGADGPGLKASIMDENPGLPGLKVNERYPDTVPLSTIPPQVLEGLPKLPEEMEFRFIGNTLILMDVHAHIIVDFIPNAFRR